MTASSSKEASLSEAESVVKSCGLSKQPELCYSQLMGSITKKKTLDHALKLLSQIQTIDPLTRGCHLIAHFIAGAEADKDISKWEEVIAKMSVGACSGGFIHGVLEARSKHDPTFVLNTQTIPQICEVIKRRTGSAGSDTNCSHIMGHLTLVTAKGDIPTAIRLCESLPQAMLYECASGVYMENETRDNVATDGYLERIPWNKETTEIQEKLCKKELNTTAQTACWRELSHMLVFISRNYPPDVYKSCSGALTSESIKECYGHAVGIMTSSSGFQDENMKYICEPYLKTSEHDFRLCYVNAVGSMMVSSPELTDRAIALCNSVPLMYATDCFTTLGKRLSSITTADQRKRLCTPAPDVYKARCELGDI